MAQLQFFFVYFFFTFALFRSSRLVSIEGDRRLEGSSAQHANVYLRSRRIHIIRDMETKMVHGRARAPPRQTWRVAVDEGRVR